MKIVDKAEVDLLQARRLELGLTLDQVCEGICSASFLSMIESGKRSPSIRMLRALYERLGIAYESATMPGLSLQMTRVLAGLKIGDMEFVRSALSVLKRRDELSYSEGRLFENDEEFAKANSKFLEVYENESSNTMLRVLSASSLISCEIALSDFHRAIQFGEASLVELRPFAEIYKDEYFELRAVLSACYSEVGDFGRALGLVEESLSDGNASGWLRAMQLWAQSNAYELAGKNEEAGALAAKASIVIQELGRPIARALLLQNHAFLSLKTGNYEIGKVLDTLVQAESIFRENEATQALAACLDTRALAEALAGNKEAALALLSEAEMYRAKADNALRGRSLLSAAETLLLLGEDDLAREKVMLARALFEGSKAGRAEAQAWRTMAKIYEALGDTEAVVVCLKASTDSLGLTVSDYTRR